jgi:putative DNA primase/helicase
MWRGVIMGEGLPNIASDVPDPTKEDWLEEPTKPHPTDFKDPENFEFAFAEYKHKLERYQARLQLHKACEELEEEQYKDIFKCFHGQRFPTYKSFCNETDAGEPIPFKPASVAEWIAANQKFKTDIDTGILYFFNGKCWVQNAEPYLEKIVSIILGEENRQSHLNNISQAFRALTYEKIEFSQKIACENGLLDTEIQTLTDFNEKEMPFHQLQITFDKEAKCPNWEEFISQVVTPDDLPTIQEWSGFLLLADYRFHKLLWVHGEGRNGKGVWERTMETILGENNISSVGLEEFDGNHRFALRQLYGKLFNPCSEPPTNKILQTPLLKKATGQDTIEAEIKGKQGRLQFRNYAKITVLANKFPKVTDNSTAFRERRLFIKFPNEFTGKNQVQNIESKWLTITDERSGILNWMLAGLKRLLDQGFFTESKTQQETEAEFLRASDTISSFLTELCIFDKNLITTRSEALEAYKNYCDVLSLEPENEKKFTARLKDTPRVSVTLVRKPKQERAWKGLGLKAITDEGTILNFVTLDTANTGVYPQTNLENSKYIEGSSRPVSDVSPVSNPEVKKAVWFVKEIPSAEKCDCGKWGVTREIVTPTKDVLRRCEDCLKVLKANFSEAEFHVAYPDLCGKES